jgi:hypothetical protein
MREKLLVVVAAALLAAGCKRKAVPTDTSQASDIPKEVAVQHLKDLLPKAIQVLCTEPKDSLKPDEIRGYNVSLDGVEVVRGKERPLILLYRDIRLVQAATAGTKASACRIFTVRGRDSDKPHFEFLFLTIQQAQQMTELITALRKLE